MQMAGVVQTPATLQTAGEGGCDHGSLLRSPMIRVNPRRIFGDDEMALFFVAYDLRKAGQNYEGLIGTLESFGYHRRIQQSLWAVQWPRTAQSLIDYLSPLIDGNDLLFVSELAGDFAVFKKRRDVSALIAAYL